MSAHVSINSASVAPYELQDSHLENGRQGRGCQRNSHAAARRATGASLNQRQAHASHVYGDAETSSERRLI